MPWSRERPSSEDVKIVHMHAEGPGPHLAPEMAGHFRHRALFIGPNARKAINDGRAEFIPVFLSDIPSLFDKGVLPLDAALINSPPDEHGFCSLGTSVDTVPAAIRCGKTIIAQLNRSMPRTLGDSFVPVSMIDFGVEVDQLPYEHADPAISDTERRIGEAVASSSPTKRRCRWVSARSRARCASTSTTRRISGSIPRCSPTLVDLVERGVVTCNRKNATAARSWSPS